MKNRIRKKLKAGNSVSISRFISEGNPNTGEKIEQERLRQEPDAKQESGERADDGDR